MGNGVCFFMLYSSLIKNDKLFFYYPITRSVNWLTLSAIDCPLFHEQLNAIETASVQSRQINCMQINIVACV